MDSIVFNVHTRSDMCPFCSMYLAHNLQQWKEKLPNIPIICVVSSRQEYRCDFEFLKERTYYKGYSMRSFGWRNPEDSGKTFDNLKKISAEGLVIQYAFEPWEVYAPQPSVPEAPSAAA